jgi:hypothetical protein
LIFIATPKCGWHHGDTLMIFLQIMHTRQALYFVFMLILST